MGRPLNTDREAYLADAQALTRALARVEQDQAMNPKKREELIGHLRAAVTLLIAPRGDEGGAKRSTRRASTNGT